MKIKFIALTPVEDSIPIFINPQYIVAISTQTAPEIFGSEKMKAIFHSGASCTLITTQKATFAVKEKASDVLQLIEYSQNE